MPDSKHSVAVETMQMLDGKNDNRSNETYPQNVGASGSDDTYIRSPNNSTYSSKTYEAKQEKPQTYVPKPEQALAPIDFDDGDMPF